jgi:hypothetical protein
MYTNKSKILESPDRRFVCVHFSSVLDSHRLEIAHVGNTLRSIAQTLDGAYVCRANRVLKIWYVFPSEDLARRFQVILDLLYPTFEVTFNDIPE